MNRTAFTGRWIVLSPHLDDAALSIGGLIAALKNFTRVEVWSLFCSASLRGPYSGLAEWLHASSGGPTGSRLAFIRQLEDRRACQHLGAHARHFGWKDSPYRKAPDGRFLYETTHPESWDMEDEKLVAEMIATLERAITGDDVVLAPLAIGRHVDHVIARHAAENLRVGRLLYYPELPYRQLFPDAVDRAVEGLCPLPYSLRRDEIVTWMSSIRFYVSQMPMLEHAAGPMSALIRKYAAEPLALYHNREHAASDLTRYRIFG